MSESQAAHTTLHFVQFRVVVRDMLSGSLARIHRELGNLDFADSFEHAAAESERIELEGWRGHRSPRLARPPGRDGATQRSPVRVGELHHRQAVRVPITALQLLLGIARVSPAARRLAGGMRALGVGRRADFDRQAGHRVQHPYFAL